MSTAIGAPLMLPALYPQESFRGYALRLRNANGFPSIKAGNKSEINQAEIASLKTLPNNLLGELSRRLPVNLIKSPDKKNRYVTHCFNYQLGAEILVRRRRICPMCLIDEPYQHLIWELKLFDTCASHGVYLVDQCGFCSRRLSWFDSSVTHCKCGGDLRETDAPKAHKFDLLTEQVTWLQLPLADDRWCPYPLELHAALRLGDSNFHRLVEFLRLAPLAEDYALILQSEHRLIQPARQLLMDALSDWPHGFRVVLKKIFETIWLRCCTENNNVSLRTFHRILFQRHPLYLLYGHPAQEEYRLIKRLFRREVEKTRIKRSRSQCS